MLILKNDSFISGYNLDFVHEVEINSSWDNLTDTATLVIPKKLVFKRDGQVVDNIVKGNDPIFNIGDSGVLSAGYDGGIRFSGVTERFKGFISDVKPNLPIDMRLEDRMYKLKQKKVGIYSKKNLTISAVLKDIISDDLGVSDIISDDRNIGYLRIKDPNTTVAGVLEHLKKTQGVISYFRGDTLVSGFAYITENPAGSPNNLIFDARKNIIDGSNLEFIKNDEYNINLTVISIYPDNTKIEISVGDDEGDKRTIYVYDVPKVDLQSRADQELLKFKYEGFRGSFETFLEPEVKHGDSVTLIDDKITDRNDTYLVKSVTTRYGVSGGRQVIELDRKIDE